MSQGPVTKRIDQVRQARKDERRKVWEEAARMAEKEARAFRERFHNEEADSFLYFAEKCRAQAKE